MDSVFEECRIAEVKLQKRIQRQEKEERATGKVSLGMADSGPVQRLKAERAGIWEPCLNEAKLLHQYVTRLRAFQEQVAKDKDFTEQRIAAVPAVIARAVCDYYYYECNAELQKLHQWWKRFQMFLDKNNDLKEALLDPSNAPAAL